MMDAIAQAVREARARRDLDRATLATRARLPIERIEALEVGRPGVTLSELDSVADALSVDRDALANGRVVDRPRASTFFRQGPWQDYVADDSVALDQILDQARDFHTLSAVLDVPRKLRLRRVFSPAPVEGARPADAARQGHRMARLVRDELERPVLPMPEMRGLLEGRFDLTVWVVALRTPVPALSLLDAGRGAAAIVLNARDAMRRENPLIDRVHLAHELCHVLFDETEPGRLHLSLEDDREGNLAESRAKGFAAEFLMPRAGLLGLLGRNCKATTYERTANERIQRAREHFGTPWEIAAWHLANHGFVDKALAETLADRPQGTTPRGFAMKLPPVDAPPAILVERVQRAWAQERITDGQARKALGLPPGAVLPFSV